MEPRTLVRWAQVFPIGNLLWSFKREKQPALLCLSVCLKWFSASCFLALEEDPGSDPVPGTFLADSSDPLRLAALQAPELLTISKRTCPLSNSAVAPQAAITEGGQDEPPDLSSVPTEYHDLKSVFRALGAEFLGGQVYRMSVISWRTIRRRRASTSTPECFASSWLPKPSS
ncbi:hypothetical protein AMECASPLE_003575 [Ameca splendens]|uniref:Uncharacterized protein n=1 Tax=Ameca splendens TaxID=208324 RepID=A0ABV0ZIU7_9TELE